MKKLLALLLVLCMVMSLVACAGGNETPTTTEGKTNNTTAAKQPDNTTAAPTTTVSDYGWQGELPILGKDGQPVQLTIGIPMHASIEDYETNSTSVWLQEVTGVDLVFIEYSYDASENKQQIALQISGGEKLPDIMWGMPLGDALTQEYGQDGYLLDLKDLYAEYKYYCTEMHANIPADVLALNEALATDPISGGMYAWPTYSLTRSMDPNSHSAMINKAWLDKIGKAAPKTVDELYEVLKLFATTDCNGNGKQDEIPCLWYAGSWGNLDEWFINAFVYLNESYAGMNVTDGKVWSAYTSDEYRQAMIYMNKLYKEGLISDQSFNIGSTDHATMKSLLSPADGVSIVGLIGGHPTVIFDGVSENFLEYEGLSYLEDATGKGGYASVDGFTMSRYYFISADCEEPEAAAKMVDFMTGLEFNRHNQLGEEGVHWRWAKEGELDEYGNQATYYKIYTGSIVSEQNNIVWHGGRQNGNSNPYTFTAVADPNAEPPTAVKQHQSDIADYLRESYQVNGRIPEQAIKQTIMNADQTTIKNEYQSLMTSYAGTARDLFITGQMDPNNDADWAKYLSELEANGLSKLVKIYQEAWDAMYG